MDGQQQDSNQPDEKSFSHKKFNKVAEATA